MMQMVVRAMMVMAVEIKMAMMVTERAVMAVYSGDARGKGDEVMVIALVAEVVEMGFDADSDGKGNASVGKDGYDGNRDSGCGGEGDGESDDGDGDGGANGKTR